MKNILFAMFCIFALSSVSTAVYAKSSSYQAKKQGQVFFENKEDQADNAASVSQQDSAIDPASVEPAAGSSDDVKADDNALAENIKLPRK